MRFFSKFTFLCNGCFLVTAFFTYTKLFLNSGKFPQPLNLIKGTVVILGYLGWIVNIAFLLTWLILFLVGKKPNVARWMLLVNLLILIFQIYYFFIDRT